MLSIVADCQQAAADALGGQRGSVVVLDTQHRRDRRDVLEPDVRPEPAREPRHQASCRTTSTLLNADPTSPALARAYREPIPPGSTFKVDHQRRSALDTGIATPDQPSIPSSTADPAPGTTDRTSANFGGESCGGTLDRELQRTRATRRSRQLGLDLGDAFVPAMDKLRDRRRTPPLDISPGAVASIGPAAGTFRQNQPFFALAGIGQGDVAVTPLADGAGRGRHRQRRRDHGAARRRTRSATPTASGADDRAQGRGGRACTPQTAATVTRHDGRRSSSAGTGHARRRSRASRSRARPAPRRPTTGNDPHAWFVAFAPAEAPRYAVAVIVEHGGNFGSEATGGRGRRADRRRDAPTALVSAVVTPDCRRTPAPSTDCRRR